MLRQVVTCFVIFLYNLFITSYVAKQTIFLLLKLSWQTKNGHLKGYSTFLGNRLILPLPQS